MPTTTLTFCDVAETHAGMARIGTEARRGFSHADLLHMRDCIGGDILQIPAPESVSSHPDYQPGWILVARNGVNKLGFDTNEVYAEQNSLEPDTKAKMRGRVVNKRARYNLCFGNEHVEQDLENGVGTVIAYDEVPVLDSLRSSIEKMARVDNLMCEGNYYYDSAKCGISLHGDGERYMVVAVRLGDAMKLEYQWFIKSEPQGDLFSLTLGHGDMYVMSEKAVGKDWKRRIIPTLRHRAGNTFPKKKAVKKK